jgi:hypothetical protein
MSVVIVAVVMTFGAIALFAGIGINTLTREYKQHSQFARLPCQAKSSANQHEGNAGRNPGNLRLVV